MSHVPIMFLYTQPLRALVILALTCHVIYVCDRDVHVKAGTANAGTRGVVETSEMIIFSPHLSWRALNLFWIRLSQNVGQFNHIRLKKTNFSPCIFAQVLLYGICFSAVQHLNQTSTVCLSRKCASVPEKRHVAGKGFTYFCFQNYEFHKSGGDRNVRGSYSKYSTWNL